MTYKQAIEQAARSEVTDEVVRKISAVYCWSELKVRKDIEHFAHLVAAAEREACAKVCEQAGIDGYGTLAAAAIIRARGESNEP